MSSRGYLSGGTHGRGTGEFAGRPTLWRDRASGLVVGAAVGRLRGVDRVHRLLDVGGVPGGALHLRPVPVAVLLAGAVGPLGAQLVRAQAGLVARLADLLLGPLDPVGPGRVPLHLLLLPRGVLQSVLGRPPELRGRRAAAR